MKLNSTKIISVLILIFLVSIVSLFLLKNKELILVKDSPVKPNLTIIRPTNLALKIQNEIDLTPSSTSAQQDNSLTASKTLPGQISQYLKTIKCLASPKNVTFSPDGKEIWVSSLLNKKYGLAIYDALNGHPLDYLNLNNGGGVEIIFNFDGSRAYVSQMETAKVYEIDTKTKKIIGTFQTKGSWTKILALSPDGQKLYASNWSSNNVSEIDLKNGEVLRLIPTVKTPRGLYLTPDNNYLYVAGFDQGELQKINLRDLSSKILIKTGGALRHFAADEKNKKLYVSDMAKNAIYVVNLETDEVRLFSQTENNPNTIKLSADNKLLFVSCRGKNASAENYNIPGPEWGSIMIFNTATGKLLDIIIGGNQPTGLDISPDGSVLAFSNFLDANISLYYLPPYEIFEKSKGPVNNYKSYLLKK